MKITFTHNMVLLSLLVVILSNIGEYSLAYSMDPPNNVVHKQITNESGKVWGNISSEIINHISKNVNYAALNESYNPADDVVIGSAEEDIPLSNVLRHFWQPDNPNGGEYNDGIRISNSSWRRAESMWEDKVIRNYMIGNIDEA